MARTKVNKSKKEKLLAGIKELIKVEDRQCSVGVYRNGKGDYSYEMKIYVENAEEMKRAPKKLKEVENAIKKAFKI